jgi:hypothetical protein
MSRKFTLIPTILAGAAAGAAIALAPVAAAAPTGCTNNGNGQVCLSPGNANITANPPQVGSNNSFGFQNGPYGPWGNTKPDH